MVVTDAPVFGSIASEVAAEIQEFAFSWLDAPVMRVGRRPYARARTASRCSTRSRPMRPRGRRRRGGWPAGASDGPSRSPSSSPIRTSAPSITRALAGATGPRSPASLPRRPTSLRPPPDADAIVVTTHALTAGHIEALGPGVSASSAEPGSASTRSISRPHAPGASPSIHTPDYCVDEVADQTLACILMLQRRMRDQERVAQPIDWSGRGRSDPALRRRPSASLGADGSVEPS